MRESENKRGEFVALIYEYKKLLSEKKASDDIMPKIGISEKNEKQYNLDIDRMIKIRKEVTDKFPERMNEFENQVGAPVTKANKIDTTKTLDNAVEGDQIWREGKDGEVVWPEDTKLQRLKNQRVADNINDKKVA